MSTGVTSKSVTRLDWGEIKRILTYEFQPVVNIHTGVTIGVEALLRGADRAGVASIPEFFDLLDQNGELQSAEPQLLQMALAGFRQISTSSIPRLFFNSDARAFESSVESFVEASKSLSGEAGSLCIEIAERSDLDMVAIVRRLSELGLRTALDNRDACGSGLRLVISGTPDFIKIDRFLIDGIDGSSRRKVVVTQVVNIARTLGCSVIAEGVETLNEFYACREAGCDYAQGYFIARPGAPGAIQERYEHVHRVARSDRRRDLRQADMLLSKIQQLQTVSIDAPLIEILNMFRNNSSATFFPVVSPENVPLGVIRERDLKSYVYSPYGISLLMNRTQKRHIHSFVYRAPATDVHTPIDRIVRLYAMDPEAEAVIITDNGLYSGVLDSRALLEVINEQELARARDQNPLSRLPGNTVINSYISEQLDEQRSGYLFAYLDFDNFKAFNDAYGFRSGDRMIVLFSDMLKELQHRSKIFVGHIGGDDFFLGIDLRDHSQQAAIEMIGTLIERFTQDAQAFYSVEDRRRGYLLGNGRDGRSRRFGLMGLSAAVLIVETDNHTFSPDDLSASIAVVKQQAKKKASGIAITAV